MWTFVLIIIVWFNNRIEDLPVFPLGHHYSIRCGVVWNMFLKLRTSADIDPWVSCKSKSHKKKNTKTSTYTSKWCNILYWVLILFMDVNTFCVRLMRYEIDMTEIRTPYNKQARYSYTSSIISIPYSKIIFNFKLFLT